MRDKHVQRIIFRQTHQRTIIDSSKKSQMCHTNRVEMHINTDIGKNETIEASQYISIEKQLRNCSHNYNLHISSLEMLSMHSHKCKLRFVRY